MRSRNTLQAVLEGTLIGAAGLIPGASGGIMAVAFGVYQEALDAIIGLFSNFKKSFSFLWPYGLGVAIGVFGCAFALEWLLKRRAWSLRGRGTVVPSLQRRPGGHMRVRTVRPPCACPGPCHRDMRQHSIAGGWRVGRRRTQ